MMQNSDKSWYEMNNAAIVETLGEFLKETRLRQNKTQQQLAFESGIDRLTIIRIENGKGGTIGTLIQLLRSLEQLHVLQGFRPVSSISPIALAKLEQKKRLRASRIRPGTKQGKSTW